MKESYREGVANHSGPESFAVDREVGSEALTGVQAGWVLSREMELFQGADAVRLDGRQQDGKAKARASHRPARSETPDMSGNSMHENREARSAPAAARQAGGRTR